MITMPIFSPLADKLNFVVIEDSLSQRDFLLPLDLGWGRVQCHQQSMSCQVNINPKIQVRVTEYCRMEGRDIDLGSVSVGSEEA